MDVIAVSKAWPDCHWSTNSDGWYMADKGNDRKWKHKWLIDYTKGTSGSTDARWFGISFLPFYPCSKFAIFRIMGHSHRQYITTNVHNHRPIYPGLNGITRSKEGARDKIRILASAFYCLNITRSCSSASDMTMVWCRWNTCSVFIELSVFQHPKVM